MTPLRWIPSIVGPFAVMVAWTGTAAYAVDPVRAEKTADAIVFTVGGKEFCRYQIAETVAKPYFYPLIAPNGAKVTRGWPMEKGLPDETTDHIHQKSAWFCHGDVIPKGLELKVKSSDKRVEGIDFWSETPNHGKIVCVHVGEIQTLSSNHLSVPTKNEWRAPDGTKILDEIREIHLLSLPAGRLLVLNIDFHASVCPICFGDTKEGALGVRVNDSIRELKGKTAGAGTMVNPAGERGEKTLWGQEAAWIDYFGPISGKTAGIAVFDASMNPHKAAWHARGYGLLAANPFGRSRSGFPSRKDRHDLVKLQKGEHLKFRYGIYVHDGDTKEGKVAEAYQAFEQLK
jgi:hypothetical protein